MKNRDTVIGEKLDPFTFEIIKRGIGGACREMFFAFARAARSPIIYEALDYGGGITNGEGELVMQTTGIPTFLGVLDFSVKDLLRARKKIEDGDVFISNVTYYSGTHVGDVSLIMPLFIDGNLDFFVTLKGHWTDIGGMAPGSSPWATEVYQESLLFDNVRIARKDKLDSEIVGIIKTNSRTPERTLGDLYAQLGALRVARNRIAYLCSKYGREEVIETARRILKEGLIEAEQCLSKLPHGEWVAEDYMDNPASGGELIKLKVKLKINESKFIADFSGSSPQVKSAVNSPYPATVSAVREVFVAITNPHSDLGSGFFRPIEVIAPEGSIFNPTWPAATAKFYHSSSYATDLIWRALARLIPEKLSAGHFLALYTRQISGIDDTSPEKKYFHLDSGPLPGGWGASYDSDGESALVSIIDGETHFTPCEVVEKLYPVRIERLTLNTKDGVPKGKFRGGFGTIMDVRILCSEARVTMSFTRFRHPAWGISGGEMGTPNNALISGSVHLKPMGALSIITVKRGDLISTRSGCGGGWGNPDERKKELKDSDLKNGYITLETAKRWPESISPAKRQGAPKKQVRISSAS